MESSLNETRVVKKMNPLLKRSLKLVLKLVIVGVGLWLTLIFVFGVFRLSGNNMYPALKDGDLCVTYKLEEYHSSDVVAYEINGEIKLGRIIARVGDTVDGDAEGLLLNGSRSTEEIFYTTNMLDTNLKLPVTLEDNEFVILNDYRDDMTDSREYGVITKDKLKGKVIFVFRRRGF